MKVLQEKIGNAEIYIQTLDDDLVVLGVAEGGRATTGTSFQTDLKAAYGKVKSAVKDIATDFGAELKSIGEQVAPSEISMELSLGLSSEGKIVWLVSGKGEFGLKVNITWDLTSNDDDVKTKH